MVSIHTSNQNMRRYSIPAILGVAKDEDDDGNAASTEKKTDPTAVLKKAIATATAEQLDDYAKKLTASKKYTPTQKAELKKMMDARLAEILKDNEPPINVD